MLGLVLSRTFFLCSSIAFGMHAANAEEFFGSDFQRDVYEPGLNSEGDSKSLQTVHMAWGVNRTKQVPISEAMHVDKVPEDPERRQDGIEVTSYVPRGYEHLRGTYYYPGSPDGGGSRPQPPVNPDAPVPIHIDEAAYGQKTQWVMSDYKHASLQGPDHTKLVHPVAEHWSHAGSPDSTSYVMPWAQKKHADIAGPQQTRMVNGYEQHRNDPNLSSYTWYLYPASTHVDAPGHPAHSRGFLPSQEKHVSGPSEPEYTQVVPKHWEHQTSGQNASKYLPPPLPPTQPSTPIPSQ